MTQEFIDLTDRVRRIGDAKRAAVALLEGVLNRVVAAGDDPAKLVDLRRDLKDSIEPLADAYAAGRPSTAEPFTPEETATVRAAEGARRNIEARAVQSGRAADPLFVANAQEDARRQADVVKEEAEAAARKAPSNEDARRKAEADKERIQADAEAAKSRVRPTR